MKRKFVTAIFCLLAAVSPAQKLSLEKYEEVVQFGSGMIGITIQRQLSPTIYIRQIKPDLTDGKKISIYEGDEHRVANYSVMGNRLVITVVNFNGNSGGTDVYFYDTTLTLISKKFLEKITNEKTRTRSESTETRFDMVEFYDREVTNYQYDLAFGDKFIDDGMLFLEFNECNMLKDPMEYTRKEMTNPNSPVVIYSLKWGQDTGIFPVNFDVKWSVKLPFKKVLAYRFYTIGKDTTLLYITTNDNDEMKSFFYKLDSESGKILQQIEVKLPGNACPWVSSSFYDEQSGKLFVVGNYQDEKNKKGIFDGYFVASVNEKGEINSVLRSFPVLPANKLPVKWEKAPMIIADDFVKEKNGTFSVICSYCYSFDEPTRMTIIGEPHEPGRVIITAAISVLRFDSGLSLVNSETFMFDHYVLDGWKCYYQDNAPFLDLNHFSVSFESIHPVFAGFSETGYAEFICPNTLEGIDVENREATTSFYLISTEPGSGMKKIFDFSSTRYNLAPSFFPGIRGEIIKYDGGNIEGQLEIIRIQH